MDLNFHLLSSSQIKSLQDICKHIYNPSKKEYFTFQDIREKVNVIIENADRDGNRPLYDEAVKKKIDVIRGIVKKEKERRQSVSERRPIFPDGLTPNDIYEEWPGNGEYRNHNNNRQRLEDFGDDKESWPKNVEANIMEDYDDPEIYDHLIDEYSDALMHLEAPGRNQITIGVESYSVVTNTDLRILALELFRLKSEQKHSACISSAATGTNTLGVHYRYVDTKRKNDIFLFLDNISNEAKALYARGIPCTTDELLEITFIHEMFHAFYAFNSEHDLIFLRHFHEIEEAMAEMGTIWFCSVYDKGRLFNLAKAVVDEKWTSGISSLACYGLGARLYDFWSSRHFLFITGYQLVQRLFRYGNPDVSRYCAGLKVWDDGGCAYSLDSMIHWLGSIKYNSSQHFYFEDQSTGENLTLVEYVLKHLAAHGGRVPKLIWVPTKGGYYQEVFKDETKIHKHERKYFNGDRIITPTTGINCQIWKYWTSGMEGNTIAFIDEIIRCYNLGWISDRVTII